MGHFDQATVPWVDRDDFAAEAERRAAAGNLEAAAREQLESWRENGFLALRGAIEPQLIDALLDDYEQAWRERPPLRVLVEGKGEQTFPEVAPRETLTHHHFRVMDFQDASAVALQVIFHDSIIGPLTRIFDAPPVAMQSLLFEYGSEQRVHQDFPYVSAQKLSHLVGCWVALEDVDASNGPLFYLPGSHRLPLFDWGGGRLTYDGKDERKVEAFESSLERACAEAGLERLVLEAKQGDVLFWHAALAHGGSPVHDSRRTRKSFVIHFSTRAGYPRDRRWPDRTPTVERVGGGYRYSPPSGSPPGLLRKVRGRIGRLLRG